MSANLRILITGASGFLGARVAEVLFRKQLADVRAGVRTWSRAARVARMPVEIVSCDLCRPCEIGNALSGVDAVVHCAATGNRSSIVDGTEYLLRAALERGVRRVVHLSTAEVYGPQVAGEVGEDFPCQPWGNDYADAKIQAEQICRQYHAHGLPVVVLRPSIVYGPFSTSWTIDVAKCLQSGRWGTFEEYGEGFCNAVYVDDLVTAIYSAVTHPAAVGQVYNVNGADTVTWNQYFRRFNDILGLPPLCELSAQRSAYRSRYMDLVGKVTGFFVNRFENVLMNIYLRGGMASRVMKRVKNALDTTPPASVLQHLYGRRAVYTTQKAEQQLGWRPQFELDAGLKLSAQWLAHHGFVK